MPVIATARYRHILLKEVNQLVVRVRLEIALKHLACLQVKDTFAIPAQAVNDARFGKQNVAYRKLPLGALASFIARP